MASIGCCKIDNFEPDPVWPSKEWFASKGVIKPTEIIVCAANRRPDGLIVCGARHWDPIMRKVADNLDGEESGGRWEQGFINQFGEFRNREDAMKVVLNNNQPFNKDRNGGSGIELYSEGLY